MIGSRLLSISFVIPLAFACLSLENSCKEDKAKPVIANSPTPIQVQSPPNKPMGAAVPLGVWGGVHIQMQVTDQGAEVEYDCAHGKILEPLSLDSAGRFQAKGIHVLDGPGPARQGVDPANQPANFSGDVKGKTMTLEVTLAGTSEPVGTFTLTQGSEGRLRKCG
jgi:hypothetical protein